MKIKYFVFLLPFLFFGFVACEQPQFASELFALGSIDPDGLTTGARGTIRIKIAGQQGIPCFYEQVRDDLVIVELSVPCQDGCECGANSAIYSDLLANSKDLSSLLTACWSAETKNRIKKHFAEYGESDRSGMTNISLWKWNGAMVAIANKKDFVWRTIFDDYNIPLEELEGIRYRLSYRDKLFSPEIFTVGGHGHWITSRLENLTAKKRAFILINSIAGAAGSIDCYKSRLKNIFDLGCTNTGTGYWKNCAQKMSRWGSFLFYATRDEVITAVGREHGDLWLRDKSRAFRWQCHYSSSGKDVVLIQLPVPKGKKLNSACDVIVRSELFAQSRGPLEFLETNWEKRIETKIRAGLKQSKPSFADVVKWNKGTCCRIEGSKINRLVIDLDHYDAKTLRSKIKQEEASVLLIKMADRWILGRLENYDYDGYSWHIDKKSGRRTSFGKRAFLFVDPSAGEENVALLYREKLENLVRTLLPEWRGLGIKKGSDGTSNWVDLGYVDAAPDCR